MEFVFVIPFGVVLVFLLAILGLAESIVSVFCVALYVLSLIFFFIAELIIAGRQVIFAVKNERGVWLLYALLNLGFGFFLPYFAYSSIAFIFDSYNIGVLSGFLISFVFLFIMFLYEEIMMTNEDNMIEKDTDNEKKVTGSFKNVICIILVLIIFVLTVSMKSYQRWTEKQMSKGLDKTVTYIVEKNCHPYVEEVMKSGNSSEKMQMFYFKGVPKYPLKELKKGEIVYGIDGSYSEISVESIGGDETFVLVCNPERKIVGYVSIDNLSKR